MAFDDLRRMQVDIEATTAAGFEFWNAARESTASSRSRWPTPPGARPCSPAPSCREAQLLAECSRMLRERDPDVIEGHNIFNFDLPYLAARARRHGVKLALGRDGPCARLPSRSRSRSGRSPTRASRSSAATSSTPGSSRSSTTSGTARRRGFGLKEVARTSAWPRPTGRTSRAKIPAHLRGGSRAADALRARRRAGDPGDHGHPVAELLRPGADPAVHYQNICVRGNATKIDALLLREYLHRGQACPARPPRRRRRLHRHLPAGVARNVHHCDVRSLYPSLMLGRDWRRPPTSWGSSLLLRDLRDFRVSAKRQAGAAVPEERIYLDALQRRSRSSSTRSTATSAFSQARFSDFDAAETSHRRRPGDPQGDDRLAAESTARPIEIDTDGIYFVPPPRTSTRGTSGSELSGRCSRRASRSSSTASTRPCSATR